jgi:hypothetical protein
VGEVVAGAGKDRVATAAGVNGVVARVDTADPKTL